MTEVAFTCNLFSRNAFIDFFRVANHRSNYNCKKRKKSKHLEKFMHKTCNYLIVFKNRIIGIL